MDYVDGGELFHKIRERKKLSERQARIWFREMIEAVDYIHQVSFIFLVINPNLLSIKNNIVHRDLKPENGKYQFFFFLLFYFVLFWLQINTIDSFYTVLINSEFQVQICDFGFGNIIQQRQEILSTYCGSPFYAAPEMVTATPYEGPPADIWSCGVILYAMLTGYLPFQADQMPELFRKIKKGEYRPPSHVTDQAVDLMKRLLCVDARRRITAKECLSHPWMAEEEPRDEEPLFDSLTSSVYSGQRYVSDDSLSSAGLETKQHYYPNVTIEKKSFFKRLFKKKAQVAPSDNQNSDKKLLKQRVMGRFKSFFLKNSLQPKLLDTSNKM